MPTKEVLNQWEASSPVAKGEGPLQGTTNRWYSLTSSYTPTDRTFKAAQSLVSAHECFAARPNAEGCSHEYHDGRLAAHQV